MSTESSESEEIINHEEENDVEISRIDKAKILGLEEIIERLDSLSHALKYNNDNMTNLREEFNIFREDNEKNKDIVLSRLGHLDIYQSNNHENSIISLLKSAIGVGNSIRWIMIIAYFIIPFISWLMLLSYLENL